MINFSLVLRFDRTRWKDLRGMVLVRDLSLHVGISGRGAVGVSQRRRGCPGHLHHGQLYRRRGGQSPPHQDQEPDLCHLLRGRGHLRTHHCYRLGRTDRAVHSCRRRQRWQGQEEELVRRILHVRSGNHHRDCQPCLRDLCGPGWVRSRARWCREPSPLR